MQNTLHLLTTVNLGDFIYIKDYAGTVNLIDAGIIMYYIDELGKTIASNSKWDINPVLDAKEYTFIASKNL